VLVATHPGVFFPRILHGFSLVAECSSIRVPLLIVGACVAIAVSATVELVIRGNFVLRIVGTIIALGCG